MNDGLPDLLSSMFRERSREGREGILSFARYLKTLPFSQNHLAVYLKLFEFQDQTLSEILFGKQKPELFFTRYTVSARFFSECLMLLGKISPGNAIPEMLQALVAAIRISVCDKNDNESLREFTVSHLYFLGSFIRNERPALNAMIVDILEYLFGIADRLGPGVGMLAGRILSSYYDNAKKLSQIIPPSILNR